MICCKCQNRIWFWERKITISKTMGGEYAHKTCWDEMRRRDKLALTIRNNTLKEREMEIEEEWEKEAKIYLNVYLNGRPFEVTDSPWDIGMKAYLAACRKRQWPARYRCKPRYSRAEGRGED